MLKPVIAAAAMLAVAAPSLAYAQPCFGPHRGAGPFGPRAGTWHRPNATDVSALMDARIAALKAGLELTPEQTKNWPAFEGALRALAQLRNAQIGSRFSSPPPRWRQRQFANPFDRLNQRADNLQKLSAALKNLAAAGTPLYQSLTPDQKWRFHMLARILRPHPRGAMWMRRGRGWGPSGPGFGPGGTPPPPPPHRSGPGGGPNGNDAGPPSKL
jgi:hypothetical protein